MPAWRISKMAMSTEILASEYADTTTMSAVGMTERPEIGGVADSLCMLDVPVPRPSDKEVAVKLVASSMHIDEIYAAQGTALGRFYGPKSVSDTSPYVLGSSVSGTVVALGKEVEGFNIGDEVVVIPSEHSETGSWATYRCVGEKRVMAKPESLTHVEAAAVTMAACVAWAAVMSANDEPNQRCVVVGASGAIGLMILQYLKSRGCHVTAVCSGRNETLVRQLGADEFVDYTKNDFSDSADSGGQKFDAVFDSVGGREIEDRAFQALEKSGVFVTVVGPMKYIGEEKLSWLAFLKVMLHIGWRIVETRLNGGPRYTFAAKYPKLVIKEAFEQLVVHDIRMPIHRVIPFEPDAIVDAVRLLTSHRTKGRLVVNFG